VFKYQKKKSVKINELIVVGGKVKIQSMMRQEVWWMSHLKKVENFFKSGAQKEVRKYDSILRS
jgi:hypothetical protein